MKFTRNRPHSLFTPTKRLLVLAIAVVMVIALGVPSFADTLADVVAPGSTGRSSVRLTTEAATFSVTVPSALPITVAADGTVTVATNTTVYNNGYGPVNVTNVAVTGQNSWSLVPFATDFNAIPVGTKQLGLKINGGDVVSADIASTFTTINGNDSQTFTYDANVAGQRTVVSGATVANVVFTVDWDIYVAPNYTFTIDGVQYTCAAGNTWEQWCGSAYNTDGYYIDNEFVSTTDGLSHVIDNDMSAYATDPISNNKAYGTALVDEAPL